MWYQESVTFRVGATSTLQALVGRQLRGACREALGDHAVGVERHVRPVLLGRADREQHGVDAGLDRGPRPPARSSARSVLGRDGRSLTFLPGRQGGAHASATSACEAS